MRILFDSQKTEYKTPFGCVTPMQPVTLCVHIPVSVGAVAVELLLEKENGESYVNHQLQKKALSGLYEQWATEFTVPQTGLYFYCFRITKATGSFRLFKQGHQTNMEAGDKWQISCIPADFSVPQWAMGATYYQIFPDRFCKIGQCDLSGKLTPYTIYPHWDDPVQPDARRNNDFYGGNFRGITEKMDYIASLGTTILYLNPICKSFSNHRYDTADYKTPDPMLGTEEDFRILCDTAHKKGIRVVLDGVFSHTGDDSLYFDRYGNFGGNGAYNSKNSPCYGWYNFKDHPDSYHCWWGFDTLPTLNKTHPGVMEYIITGRDSVLSHWLNLGADGFRLDVADELPEEFLDALKTHLRKLRPDALLIGEVWEDASNKQSYGKRRHYFTHGQLDSVMNYPWRRAIIKLLRGEDDGRDFRETVETILENYPSQVIHCNMNLLGSHDTPRILTALGSKKSLTLASVLQYTLPGSPSLYYGDEAGMEGEQDPFNRGTYPWGRADETLVMHYRSLGNLRRQYPALRLGSLEFLQAENGEIAFTRTLGNSRIKIYVNLKNNAYAPQGRVLLQRSFGDCSYVITEES